MPRPKKCRRVQGMPECTYFKPAGVPLHALEEECLTMEECEAVRLKDLEGLEQEECGARMGVSRATFQRMLLSARQKIARAITRGKALRIEGGHYELEQKPCCCRARGHFHEGAPEKEHGEIQKSLTEFPKD